MTFCRLWRPTDGPTGSERAPLPLLWPSVASNLRRHFVPSAAAALPWQFWRWEDYEKYLLPPPGPGLTDAFRRRGATSIDSLPVVKRRERERESELDGNGSEGEVGRTIKVDMILFLPCLRPKICPFLPYVLCPRAVALFPAAINAHTHTHTHIDILILQPLGTAVRLRPRADCCSNGAVSARNRTRCHTGAW